VAASGVESRGALAIYTAAGASFAALAARGLLVPLYAHELGASRFEVGALFSVSTLAAALMSLPAGLLVDRFGARSLLWTSMVIAAATQLATAATTTVAPLFAWQVVGGLAGGAQQSALLSAVAESVPAGRLGRAMGWLTFSMQAGFFLGPSLAGVALGWLDVRTDLAATAALLLLALPGVRAATSTRQVKQGLELAGPLRALMSHVAFVPVIIGLVSITLVSGTVGAFLPIFGREALRLPSSQVGYLLALQAVANGLSRIPAGRLVDHVRHRWPIVFAGAIAWSAAAIVLGHLGGFWAPAVLIVVATPFIAAAYVAIGVVFGNLAEGSTRGVAMGAYGTVLFLALAAGPLMFGPIVQAYGYAAGFTASGVVAIVLALVMAALNAEPFRARVEIRMPPAAPGT
jgi:DHA1 family multidrug resistance protein-like MFS transporter